jgi:hypothetical protein
LLSSGQEFDEKFLDSKHVLKVYFKPSRKNKDFVLLPVPILPGWLKILHLKQQFLSFSLMPVFSTCEAIELTCALCTIFGASHEVVQ